SVEGETNSDADDAAYDQSDSGAGKTGDPSNQQISHWHGAGKRHRENTHDASALFFLGEGLHECVARSHGEDSSKADDAQAEQGDTEIFRGGKAQQADSHERTAKGNNRAKPSNGRASAEVDCSQQCTDSGC